MPATPEAYAADGSDTADTTKAGNPTRSHEITLNDILADHGSTLSGEYTAVFWALVVFVGLLIPLLVEAVEAHKHLRPTRVTSVLVLSGGLAVRWILVSAGQS